MGLHKNNQKGFTLVEIMIAVGLLGGLAVAGMSLFKSQTKAQKTVEANYEVVTLFSELRILLSDIDNCTNSFFGQVPTAGSVNNLKKGPAQEVVFQKNTLLPGNIKINSYTITRSGYTGTLTANETLLRVSFSRGKSAIKDEITKTMKIVYTGGATITSCYAFANNTDSYWLPSTVDPADIYYGGDVGIGLTDPQSKLDVNGSGRFQGQNTPTVGAGVEVGYSASVGYVQSYDRGAGAYRALNLLGSEIRFSPFGTQRMILDGSGNLGIGTPTPNALLHVNGSINLGQTSVATSIIDGYSGADTIIRPRINNNYVKLMDSDTSSNVRFYSDGTGYIDSFNTDGASGSNLHLQQFSGAAVGIGTGTVNHKLHVNGSVAARTTVNTDGYIMMTPGSAGVGGYLEFYRPGGIRNAYFGHAPYGASNLGLVLENGANFTMGNGNVNVGSGTMWGKFNVEGGRAFVQTGAEPYSLGVGRSGDARFFYLGISNGHGVFSNNAGTELMRIEEGGNVGIGTPAPTAGYKLDLAGNMYMSAANPRILFWGGGSIYTPAANYIDHETSGALRFRIAPDGTSTFYGALYANSFIYNPSDARLKKDVRTIENPLDKISKFRGVYFTWKKDNEKDLGFIAQEVEKIEPMLVKEHEGKKHVRYLNVIAIVVEALKELKDMVMNLISDQDEMKAEIKDLKKQNDMLKKHLELQEARLNQQEAMIRGQQKK